MHHHNVNSYMMQTGTFLSQLKTQPHYNAILS